MEYMADVIVDGALCTGCGICVDECPSNVFDMEDDLAKPNRLEGCTACKLCEIDCPSEAIKVKEN